MNAMIANLLNGNLEDAKKQARRYKWQSIFHAFIERGDSVAKASAAADYLKGQCSFQTYCDAK